MVLQRLQLLQKRRVYVSHPLVLLTVHMHVLQRQEGVRKRELLQAGNVYDSHIHASHTLNDRGGGAAETVVAQLNGLQREQVYAHSTPPPPTCDHELRLDEVLRLAVGHADLQRLQRVVVYSSHPPLRVLSITHCW